jgi:PilZ domain
MFLSRFFTSDRRRHPRQFLNTSVRVFTDSQVVEGVGVNISSVGMCLFTAANLPVGSQIEVEYLPLDGDGRVRLAAIVRHRALYLYGIEFQSDSATEQAVGEGFREESPNL